METVTLQGNGDSVIHTELVKQPFLGLLSQFIWMHVSGAGKLVTGALPKRLRFESRLR